MKKLNIIKKIVVSIMIISAISSYQCVQASTIGDAISGGKDFISAANPSSIPVNGGAATDVSSNIYNLFLGVAIVVAVVCATYLGVQYMVSSAMDKAKVKESALALALGCLVAFGAFGIWRVLVTMLGTI